MLPLPALDPKYVPLAEQYVRLHYQKGAYGDAHKNLLYSMTLYLALPILEQHTFVSVAVPNTTPEAELKEKVFKAVYEGSVGMIHRDDLLAAYPGMINMILQQRGTLRDSQ